MQYIYGYFTKKQIKEATQMMHSDVHKLLLYKDNKVEEQIFEDDDTFLQFFQNVLTRFAGTKTLFNNCGLMVSLMSTLQSAYDEVTADKFHYIKYRRLILEAHEYIRLMFEGGEQHAKFINS